MIKVFGIGNILLKDDGIGVKVGERIKKDLYKNNIKEIEVIIGETNYFYCLENINDDDFIIIIDSTYLGLNPGDITFKRLKDCDELIGEIITEHEISLLRAVRIEKRNIDGYFIGIEISEINYSLDLSEVLTEKFDYICSKIYKFINEIKLKQKED